MRLRSDPVTSAVVRSKYEPLSSGRPAVVAVGEVEELHLRGDVEREATVPRPLEVAAQHLTWVALERSAVEVQMLQKIRASGAQRIGPREQLETVGVQAGQHVLS